MNHKSRNKDLIDQTIIRIKEKYPDMDTFLYHDYNTRCDIISTIVSIHEETIKEVTKEGIDIGLPFIGRLTIKKGKLIYDDVVNNYLKDNSIEAKNKLTDEDRNNIIDLVRKKMLVSKLQNSQTPCETRVMTFKKKVINNV